jgi:two-component system chemotaxis response regulator CheY
MQALVIDDSRAVRMVIGGILREVGFEVVEAANGQEALDRLEENPDVGVALVDWNMPVMDGLEFIKAVRKAQRWNHVRIMMVTTETESERLIEAISAGANEYVMKPFSRDVLVAKLSMLDVLED